MLRNISSLNIALLSIFSLLFVSTATSDSGRLYLSLITLVAACIHAIKDLECLRVSKSLLFFLFLILTGALFSTVFYNSLIFVSLAFSYFVFYRISGTTNEDDIKRLPDWMTFLLYVSLVPLAVSIFPSGREMLIGSGIEPLEYVSVALLGLPFALMRFIRTKKAVYAVPAISALILLIAVSRAGIASFGVTVVLYLLTAMKKRRDLAIAGIVIVFVIVAVIFRAELTAYSLSFGKLSHIFSANFLFGTGLGNFSVVAGQYFPVSEENRLLSSGAIKFFAETGLLTVPLIFSFLTAFFVAARKYFEDGTETGRAVFAACFSFIILSIFHPNIYFPTCAVTFFFLLGFLFKKQSGLSVHPKYLRWVFPLVALLLTVLAFRSYLGNEALLRSADFKEQRDNKKALDFAIKAWSIDNTNPEIGIYLGGLVLENVKNTEDERFSMGSSAVERSIKLDKYEPAAWRMKGMFEMKAGNPAGAYLCFREAGYLSGDKEFCAKEIAMLEVFFDRK